MVRGMNCNLPRLMAFRLFCHCSKMPHKYGKYLVNATPGLTTFFFRYFFARPFSPMPYSQRYDNVSNERQSFFFYGPTSEVGVMSEAGLKCILLVNCNFFLQTKPFCLHVLIIHEHTIPFCVRIWKVFLIFPDKYFLNTERETFYIRLRLAIAS